MIQARLGAFASAGALALATLAGGVVIIGRAGDDAPIGFLLVSLWLGLALGSVGILLTSLRRAPLLGAVLLTGGATLVVSIDLRSYAYVGLHADPGSLPFASVAGWLGLWLDAVFFPASLVLTMLLFPNGDVRSRTWRRVALGVLALTAVRVLARALRPGPVLDDSFHYRIPWHGVVPAQGRHVLDSIDGAANTVLVSMVVVTGIGLLLRFRAASGIARRQYAPLALAALIMVIGLLMQIGTPADSVGVALLIAGFAVGLPVALAIGALRYRLWELDRLVVAAITYAGLGVLVAGVYLALVVGVGALAGSSSGGQSWLAILATAIVALLFAPARGRLTRGARRLVYGVRATPYEALVSLPHRLADAPEIEEVLPTTAETLARGLGVQAARVRAFLEDGTRREAWHPADAICVETDLVAVSVRHLGIVVGDVAVLPSPERPLGPADQRLLEDLAIQAGPALRSVGLAAQLRAQVVEIAASRQRIAAASVAERRRIERDIHDGAQQQLIAIAILLQSAERLAAMGDQAAVDVLRECQGEVANSIAGLRDLARGIYPPVLLARGLVAALRARARSAPGDVCILATPEAEGQRFTAGVEVAVYFCCLEAIQNALKHAPGAPVTVRIAVERGCLVAEVRDEGPGFPIAVDGGLEGTGLLGMRDRLAAIGGTLRIDSNAALGTVVRGEVPVVMPDAGGAGTTLVDRYAT